MLEMLLNVLTVVIFPCLYQVFGTVDLSTGLVSVARVTGYPDLSASGVVWQQAAAATPPISPV